MFFSGLPKTGQLALTTQNVTHGPASAASGSTGSFPDKEESPAPSEIYRVNINIMTKATAGSQAH